MQKEFKYLPVKCKGYIIVYVKKHPYANRNRIAEHRIKMEKYLGRYLVYPEIVHHINGIRDDNRIENLMYFKDSVDHLKYHRNIKKALKKTLEAL